MGAHIVAGPIDRGVGRHRTGDTRRTEHQRHGKHAQSAHGRIPRSKIYLGNRIADYRASVPSRPKNVSNCSKKSTVAPRLRQSSPRATLANAAARKATI